MDLRKAFEAWQLDTGRTDPMYLVYSDKDNRYALNNVQSDWDAWQAAWQAALASQWQPIETAPKDGTPVLCVVAGFQPAVAEYHENIGWWYGDDDYPPEDWLICGDPYEPTHWMPLPPDPAK